VERRAITVQGVVQGVGFRPFVFALASRLGLSGFVQNVVGGVLIEVEGDAVTLDRFLNELTSNPPSLALIQQLTWENRPPCLDRQFRIEPSTAAGVGPIFISPDVATCADCLGEMWNPADRRHCYPFINCTNCGPRLTIVTGAPYDRRNTTMAGFVMCATCRAEYENPADRRYHAQPTCCPDCGPRLQLLDSAGQEIAAADPVELFADALRAGRIGALKGLGGYHLACDARSSLAVSELRHRKQRDDKPFAVMVPDVAAAEALCEIGPGERELLLSIRRPIVLLRKRTPDVVAAQVAPRNPYLGVMLPYTPLHHLLLRAVAGTPLVMTSGNRSDEPIVYEDADALKRLADIADIFLIHNRPIHVRCDDSVTRIVTRSEMPLRRSRGYAPQSIPLPFECPIPILAVGGQLKGTFALGHGRHAILSHHLGDLDHYDAYRAFVRDVALYEELFAIHPEFIVYDLHPDYASTHYAMERGIRSLAVQHHHAHIASCMVERGLNEPVIGVAFDGTGYGTDGTVWGGEFLIGDYDGFRRAAHLRCVAMPGGEQAIREPWRMALAHLVDAEEPDTLLRERIPAVALRVAIQMLERRFHSPLTSSAGRLFDAVAVLAGVRDRVNYEGQAAIELEWLATGLTESGTYPFELSQTPDNPLQVDTRPIIRAVAHDARQGTAPALIARRFHSTIVEIIVAVCERLRGETGLTAVALSGGVFMNVLLTEEVRERLQRQGFRVYLQHQVPANDGGLSLGQLALAVRQTSL